MVLQTRTGLPPHDVAAEEAVVAAILLDDEAVLNVIPIVQPADFYREHNGWVYEAAIAIAERGETVTMWTVAHEMTRAGRLDAAGGEPYLADVVGRHFTAVGVEAHARIVARDAYYRRLIAAASQVAQLAYEGGPEAERVGLHALRLLEGAAIARAASNSVTAEQVVAEVVEQAANGVDVDHRPVVRTGLRLLDEALGGGLGIGELAVIGAHTSVGKTALAATIAYRQGLHAIPVGYITVEGLPVKIMHRLAAYEAGVSLDYVSRRGWGPDERDSYYGNMANIGSLPIHFAEPAPRTPEGIESWMRRLHRSDGVMHFVVDHIDRVNFNTGRDRNLVAAYRDALTRWGNLANEEGFAVTVLSQVNRDAEWHPPMSHLREAGAKEELAQVVLMLSQGDNAEYRSRPQDHEHEIQSGRLGPRRGTFVNVQVAKFTEGRVGWVQTPNGRPAFYIDSISGALMEVGE